MTPPLNRRDFIGLAAVSTTAALATSTVPPAGAATGRAGRDRR
ncbi:MAG: twin-arginine translocation signal domain-containing protein, partial [Isosphaeraceae bacterium]